MLKSSTWQEHFLWCLLCLFQFWVLWNKFPLSFSINYFIWKCENLLDGTLGNNPTHKQAEKHQVRLSFHVYKNKGPFIQNGALLCSELMNTWPIGLSQCYRPRESQQRHNHRWTTRKIVIKNKKSLFPCLDYFEQSFYEHRGTGIFSNYSFVQAQHSKSTILQWQNKKKWQKG